ncbi:MAG: quinone-dependent dihydroorotate dehydrogenase [Chloroflexota bacterium]
MSLYPPLRSLLFKLEPEQAHHLTLQLVRLVGLLPPLQWVLSAAFAAPQKQVEVFGLKFKNPVGLAAGYDKDGIAIQGLSALGFGHIEIGTVTPRPQPGNPQPRVFRLVEDESVINRMGFPSLGTEYVQTQLNPALAGGIWEWISGVPLIKTRKIKSRKRNFILGVNLGKNKDTPNEQAVFDYLSLLQNYAPLADYLTINVSSPNTVGLRSLQGRDALHALLTQLHAQRLAEQTRLNKKLPLLVKLAPDLSDAELDDALDVIMQTGMDGVIATNTTLSREGLRSAERDESGGLSGRALTSLSDQVLTRVVQHVDGRIPVVGVGGIMGPEDARRKLALGASLVQVYTGLIYAGPALVQDIMRKI